MTQATTPKRQPITTDRTLRGLKPEAAPYEHAVAGTQGLRIRISPTGRKTWFCRFRRHDTGKLEKLKLGTYPAMTLLDAKRATEKQRELRDEHGSARAFRDNDRAEKAAAMAEKQQEAESQAYTVARLIDEYDRAEGRTKKTWRVIRQALDAYIVAPLGDIPLTELRRRDIVAALDAVAAAGKPVMRNRVLAYFKPVLRWAVVREMIETDPSNLIARLKEAREGRALDELEQRRFMRNIASAPIEPKYADLYLILAYTGLRPSEAVQLRFEHVKSMRGIAVIDLPGEVMKMGKPFTVPVTPQVQTIIDRRRQATRSGFLFPADTDVTKHIGPGRATRPFASARKELGLYDDATPKAWRKTLATEISALRDAVGQRCDHQLKLRLLAHHDNSVHGRHYDKGDYLHDKLEWLAIWADHLDALADAPLPANVVELERAHG